MSAREKTFKQVVVLLGSNVDGERNLPAAVGLLRQLCQVVDVSSVYETIPVGLVEQPNFLNAAVLTETELDAAYFKSEVLTTVEEHLGRQRGSNKNAPRTIDADIVLFDQEILDLGHRRRVPDLLKYPYVAIPVAELLPNLPHPETGESLAEIARRLMAEATQHSGRPPLWQRPDINL